MCSKRFPLSWGSRGWTRVSVRHSESTSDLPNPGEIRLQSHKSVLPGHPTSALQECPTRMPCKSCPPKVRKECLARVADKTLPQECPTRVSPTDCPTKKHTRVSHKSVDLQSCPLESPRVPPNSVQEECPTGARHKSVLLEHRAKSQANMSHVSSHPRMLLIRVFEMSTKSVKRHLAVLHVCILVRRFVNSVRFYILRCRCFLHLSAVDIQKNSAGSNKIQKHRLGGRRGELVMRFVKVRCTCIEDLRSFSSFCVLLYPPMSGIHSMAPICQDQNIAPLENTL